MGSDRGTHIPGHLNNINSNNNNIDNNGNNYNNNNGGDNNSNNNVISNNDYNNNKASTDSVSNTFLDLLRALIATRTSVLPHVRSY